MKPGPNKRSFSQHKLIVEDTRIHYERGTARVTDAEPINLDVTTTPKKLVQTSHR